MRPRLRFALVAIALALASWGSVGDALARPGGGGSYHGGGGGGGVTRGGGGGTGRGAGYGGGVSSGYHGDGSSDGAGAVFVLLVVFGLVVGIIVVARMRRAAFAPGAGNAPPAPFPPVVSLDALRARDPALTEQSIADHVRAMADILRDAWCRGDMRPARPFVSDGVYSRFQVQLALMRQENRRNIMSDARVLGTTLEGVEDAPPLDVVHVRLVAEARDTEVPAVANDDQIRAALARTRVEPYTEIWSIVRRAGAQTKQAGFAVGRACPSCGAPLAQGEIGETMKCRYCSALVCSGEHDWVLAEITQLDEWRPGSREPRGLEVLRARDAGVAQESLEDRASYVFWKWIEAGRAGSYAPLRKCAAPWVLDGRPPGARIEWTRGASDVAVGGAQLLACELGTPGDRDHAHVEVFWSARFGGSRDYTPARTVFTLGRKSGVVSRLSMTALVCQVCGAPLTETDTTKCDHCGADLAAGDQAWVLDAVNQAT